MVICVGTVAFKASDRLTSDSGNLFAGSHPYRLALTLQTCLQLKHVILSL